jgi:hypothetical protein
MNLSLRLEMETFGAVQTAHSGSYLAVFRIRVAHYLEMMPDMPGDGHEKRRLSM